MKKALKITAWIILTPIILMLLLVALFYFPPFQNWAVKQVASYASDMTGMEITVDHVNLGYPLDLAVDGVKVIQTDSLTQRKDTVADIERTLVDVQLWPLLKGQVEVDELDIQKMKFNTTNFIAQARVKGNANRLNMKSHGIDLSNENVILNEVLLDGSKVDVQLIDTVVPEDTSKSENYWKIALQKLQVKNTDVTLHMPGDTLTIGAYLGDANVGNGYFDLEKSAYKVGTADLKNCRLSYDNNFERPVLNGLDYNHLALSDVNIGLDSLSYEDPDIYVKIRNASLKEKSGLQLSAMTGSVKMDSLGITIPKMMAATPSSNLDLQMYMDMNAFDDLCPGQMQVKAYGQLGREDLMLFMSDMPSAFRLWWPYHPLSFNCDIYGNLQQLYIRDFKAQLPTAFKASANGYVANMTNPDYLRADVNLDATTYNLNFATRSYLDPSLLKTINIPSGINVKGNIKANRSTYQANLKASQGGGWATLKGAFNLDKMAYKANVVAHALPIQNFVPHMGLSSFSGKLNVDGAGTDIYSSRTHIKADAKIDRFKYTDYDISGSTATANIHNGMVDADINCVNKLISGQVSLSALLKTNKLSATVGCQLDNLDLYGLKMVDSPLSTSLCAHVDVASDLNEYYKVEGTVGDVVIRDSSEIYLPEDLDMDIETRTDTTWAKVNSGDFNLDLAASGGYKKLMKVATSLTDELTRQIDRKYISQDSIKQVLPIGHLVLHTGMDNFIAQYIKQMDYCFREVNADFTTSPVDGINGYAQVDSLIVSGMQLDKVRLDVETDETGFKYKGQVKNEKDNPQYCFNALFDGSLFETGSNINLALYDQDDKLGIKMGLKAMLENNGIRVQLADTDAVLGYRKFKANKDNYLFLADDNRVSARMQLTADDGTGLQIYSDDDNLDALQDITVGINQLDLESIAAIIPYCPKVQGIMDGDFHIIQTEKELSVSSSLGVDNLIYEDCKMGDLSSEFVYIPEEDGSHYVDGVLMKDGTDVGTIKGTYTPGANEDEDGRLDAKLGLDKIPLELANGFIPDQIMGLRGYGDGTLNVTGPLSKLDIDGELDLDSAYLFSIPYGVELRFDDRPVKIQNSKLVLENFNMYSHNKQPLVIDGNVDFSNTDNMTMYMKMTARNFLLIDSKENRKSEAFGKAYVNFDALASGPLSMLKVRGTLDVLGSTDITYIMRDTPLTTDNRLDELVKFTDFNSPEEEKVEKPTIEGLTVDMNINIDQGVRVFCALNAIKSNYVDLVGGGKLRFVMSGDDMRMTGRYTISDGEMKYSLPVIPLQTFNIDDGSYVEFTGDVMNPTLNITATENIKTNVSENGSSRNVSFETGVVITQTLNDMGLEFVIDAPEDMTIHSNLQTMSKEERGKIAVSMLTTGMYLSSSNTQSMTMNSALNSFLQSEINSITGNALRTLDLSIGLDNSTDATGQLHTDYSFKFAKRFWNNRVRLVVGGKVSSGTSQTQSLFDNLALEYRLDQSANTNLKVFYERQVYDYLEGYVGEYGVGLVWKRNFEKFSDLYNMFRRKNKNIPIVNPDSTVVKKGGEE